MSKEEKLIEKFYKKPIPNDITYEEVARIAGYFGCTVLIGRGKHSMKVVHKESGTVIPIPKHGNHVKEAYIKQLKDLFNQLR